MKSSAFKTSLILLFCLSISHLVYAPPVLIDNIDGGGTLGRIPYFSHTYEIMNSNMYYTSGNIGIDVAIPTTKLDVNGTVNMTGFKLATGATNGYVLVSDANGNGTWQALSSGSSLWTNSIVDPDDIYYWQGNVGIGTGDPQALLDVNGSFKTNSFKMATGAANGYVLVSDASGNGTWQAISTGSNSPWNESGDNIYFGTTTGNVGIGTSNPVEKVHIYGASPNLRLQDDGNGSATFQLYRGASERAYLQANSSAAVLGAGSIPLQLRSSGSGDNSIYFTTYDGSWIDRAYIQQDGDLIINERLGIGTTNPSTKLDVRGNISFGPNGEQLLSRVAGENGGDDLIISNDQGTYYQRLRIMDGSSESQFGFTFETSVDNGSNWSKEFFFQGGNLGIGTSTPEIKLDVKGDIGVNNHNFFIRNDMSIVNDSPVYGIGLSDVPSGGSYYMQISDYYGINFLTQNISRLAINKDGSIGVGTTDTFGYKLAVNGTIGAKEVIVETTSAWPDYVFEEGYELQSLEEIEAFTKENKHLPNVPNQEEVKENGINVGEMNAILLQKIEELTLHIIEQQKQIDNLKEKVNELNN